MRKTRAIALTFVVLGGVAYGCTPAPRAAPLDAPMVDIPVATSSADAAPMAVVVPPPDGPLAASAGCALEIPARDTRRSRTQPRSASLVATELTQLERLLDATPAGAADRPTLLRRLAEEYAELGCAYGASDPAGVKRARQGAIDKYDALANGYPAYAQIDDVYYYSALEYELMGDLRTARSRYYTLISKQPASKHIPAAYFAFGEMFYAESQSDPSKTQLALQAYAEVLKYPAPKNGLYADAERRVHELKKRLSSP